MALSNGARILTTGWLRDGYKDLDIDPVKKRGTFLKQVLYRQGVQYLAPKNDRGEQGSVSQKRSLLGG